jgi:FdhE protein
MTSARAWEGSGSSTLSWRTAWLRCPYCGETDHQRLGVLIPAAPGATGTVETCATCTGYLKTRATLQALPAYAVALEELAMIELDMVALERGFTRPASPAGGVEARHGLAGVLPVVDAGSAVR